MRLLHTALFFQADRRIGCPVLSFESMVFEANAVFRNSDIAGILLLIRACFLIPELIFDDMHVSAVAHIVL